MKFLILPLLAALWALPTLAEQPAGAADVTQERGMLDEPPELEPPSAEDAEDRAHTLSKMLRCPVCQALSVADSNAEAAQNMAGRVEELVEMGYSDDQIMDYFVGRYGEWILLQPRAVGMARFVYVAPVVAIVVGGAFVALRVRGSRESEPAADRAREATAGAPALEPAPARVHRAPEAYRRRILVELGDIEENA